MKISQLEKGSYEASEYSSIITIHTPDERFTNLQGSYFDGEKYVLAFTKGSQATNDETAVIGVYTKDGKLVKSSKELFVEHANNITYVKKKNAYLVSYCQPTYAGYSFIDADTLEEIQRGELDVPFFAMTYCEKKDMYASGYMGGEKIHIRNGNLELVNEYSAERPTSLSQGVTCDEDKIYFIRSYARKQGTFSEVRIYGWDGELQTVANIRKWDTFDYEPESLAVIDGDCYALVNTTPGDCEVIRLRFE